MKKFMILATSFLVLFIISKQIIKCSAIDNKRNDTVKIVIPMQKKVVFINSYHSGYEWSDGIYNEFLSQCNITKTENGLIDCSKSSIDLVTFEMNSKNNTSQSYIENISLKIKNAIDSINPDAIVCSDDNAIKYIIEPYFNNGKTPVIFSGVNNNLDEYHLAMQSNITGILEIGLYEPLIKELRKYAKGNRVSHIEGNNISAKKEFQFFSKIPGFEFNKPYLVDNFQEWKAAIKTIEKNSDIVLINNNAGIKDWNEKEAIEIINNLSIVSGSIDSWMIPYNLMIYAKKPEDHGRWCANALTKILQGTKPSEIPVSISKKATIILNMNIAKKLQIEYPMQFIENATLYHYH